MAFKSKKEFETFLYELKGGVFLEHQSFLISECEKESTLIHLDGIVKSKLLLSFELLQSKKHLSVLLTAFENFSDRIYFQFNALQYMIKELIKVASFDIEDHEALIFIKSQILGSNNDCWSEKTFQNLVTWLLGKLKIETKRRGGTTSEQSQAEWLAISYMRKYEDLSLKSAQLQLLVNRGLSLVDLEALNSRYKKANKSHWAKTAGKSEVTVTGTWKLKPDWYIENVQQKDRKG